MNEGASVPIAAFPKERAPIKEFFNLVGLKMFGAEWPGTEAATPVWAEIVANELHHALSNEIIFSEVDFRAVKRAPLWLKEAGGEICYYRVKPEAWRKGARAFWHRNLVRLDVKYFEVEWHDEFRQCYEHGVFNVFGYIRHPERALNNLVQITAAKLRGFGKVKTNFRIHLWSEITAVLWRELAIAGIKREGGEVARGEKQRLVTIVSDYLTQQEKYLSLKHELPSEGQIFKVIDWVLEQFTTGSTRSSVVPTFDKSNSG